ncbi:hypothetical protein ABPG75_007255 [Micractinium tetrahymenae]
MPAIRASAGAFVAALLLFSSLCAVQAKTIPLTWVHGRWFANINACVGDTVAFSWSNGSQHDVVEVKSRTCSAAGGSRLTGVSTKGYKAVKLSKAGTRHFMCSVGPHCALGQTVTVTAKSCSG